jgi:Zn-dependent protease
MWLIRHPFARVLITIASGVGNWFAFVWLFREIGIPNPTFEASALLVSVLVHECAHAIAMKLYGVPSLIVFFVIAGGTSPLDTETYERLRDGRKAGIALAGMLGNVAVACVAIVLGVQGYLTHGQVDHLLNMNAALVLFNMIPILGFDGSRFVRLLFHNINPAWDVELFELTAVPVAVAMMVLLYLKGGVTIAIPLILVELYFKSRRHNTAVRGTMNRDEQLYWGIVYAVLVVGAIIVFTHTSNWSV